MTYYTDLNTKQKAERISSFNPSVGAKEGIKTQWFQHVEGDAAKQEFAAVLRNSTNLLDTLKAVLVKEYESLLVEKESDYEKVNWALTQADKTGYKRAIQNFINLLTITK